MRVDACLGVHFRCAQRSVAVTEALAHGRVSVRSPRAPPDAAWSTFVLGTADASSIVHQLRNLPQVLLQILNWVELQEYVIRDPSWQLVVGAEALLVDGLPIKDPFQRLIALNKPPGCVCARDKRTDPSSHNVFDVIDACGIGHPKMGTIGRLDKDTTGLLLCGSDGGLQALLTHPASKLDKTYEIRLRDPASFDFEAGAHMLAQGLVLPDAQRTACAPAVLSRSKREGRLLLTIEEGFNHQVKRMIGALGGCVQELHRVSVGPIALGCLNYGEARVISASELRALARAIPMDVRGQGVRDEWAAANKEESNGRPTEGSQRKRRREKRVIKRGSE